jgi:hypothetical protein
MPEYEQNEYRKDGNIIALYPTLSEEKLKFTANQKQTGKTLGGGGAIAFGRGKKLR